MSSDYDPTQHGARCDVCPLRGSVVVPPDSGRITDMELLSGEAICVVGESPGEAEEKMGRPFVGPAGDELNKALKAAGLRRDRLHTTHALLCRPPNNRLDDLLRRISRRNKERAKEAKDAGEEPPPPIPSPLDCCRPRLEQEIAPFQKFIALGKRGMQSITGSTASIMAVRGGMMDLEATPKTPRRLVMPTVHPSFVIKQRRWSHVFRSDIAKAARWFRGEAQWQPPEIVYHPSPDELREFLQQNRIYTFDLETDGIESLTTRIRCVGIGFPEKVVVVGILSKDGQRRFYAPEEEREVVQILKEFFADESKVKAGHNAGYYDKIVLQQQWGIDPKPILDTMLLHRNVESELPHGLGYVGSLYTEVPAWKSDRDGQKLATDSESDEQLHEYCAVDVSVTASVLPKLAEQVRLRQQVEVWKIDQKMQAICADMHTVGMYVDQEKRLAEERSLLARRFDLLSQIRDLTGRPQFNPASIYQVRDLLFDTWKLTPPVEEEEMFTASGDPSTADLILRALLTDRIVPDDQRSIIKLIRYYRKVLKVLGTYVVKLRPWDVQVEEDLGWDDDEDWVDKETRKKYGLAKRGIVNPRTGRMHPGYNAHVASCVVPETWLLGEQGLFQIGTLAGFGPPQSERPAEGLILHDGSGFAEVSYLQNPGTCPTLQVQLALGIELVGTPHHRVRRAAEKKFLRQDSKGKWHPIEPPDEWVRLDELDDDYVKVPIGMNIWGTRTTLPRIERLPVRTNANEVWLPDVIDVDLGLFMGAYNADGSMHDANGSFVIRLSDTSGKPEMREIELAARRLFGPDAVQRNAEGITVTSISLARWCEALEFGRGLQNKRIPAWLLAAPKPVVLAYIKGLSLDSNITLNAGVTPVWCYTGSKELAQSLQMLLLNLGIPSGLADKRTKQSPNTWSLVVCGEDVHRVVEITGQAVPVPTRAGDRSQSRPKYIRRGNHLWLRVKRVSDAGLRQVYDVTIPTTHQFWANGTVSHNTGRLSSSKPINCFDGETEILTEQGWVRLDALPRGLRVAQWHNDGSIEFAEPTAYHEGLHKGNMVAFCSQSADLLMTPNHRLPLLKNTGMRETITAADLLTLGAGRNTFHAGHLLRPEEGLDLSYAEIKLLVAIHADGSFVRQQGKAYGVDLGFTKSRKVERMRAILKRLDSRYTWKEGKTEKRFYISSTPRLEEILQLIGREQRQWGSWLFQLSEAQADIFEEELWHWDACAERRRQYANKDEVNADWVQAFLCTRGIRANKRHYTNAEGNSVWIIDVRRTRTNAITPEATRTTVPWSDRVYCVTVPSDAIVVRRRGKVTITRQSQNFPKGMRGMVVAQPGHVLVGADMDQLELRIAAARWKVQLYLRAFADGKDPHSMTAYAVFGSAFLKAAGLTADQFDRPGPLVGASYANGKFEGTGEDKKMRDLSKAVQYACVRSDQEIITLDGQGTSRIDSVQVGSWTWAWSTRRKRYEPAEITAVVPRGVKPCVRVTFGWWGGPKKGRCVESMVVTRDHLCLLRDGTFRAAGALRAGDRLMPFRRREMPGTGYRAVHPFNDAVEVGEHRVVMGFYAAGEGDRHVHHKDEAKTNNVPDNLEVLPQPNHYDEHKEAIAQGRRESFVWRAAVSDPETRSAASKKAWEGRRERQDTDGTFGQRASVLDPWAEKIGKLPDAEVAALADCTQEAVAYYRKTRNIPPPPGQRGWLKWLLVENPEWRDYLFDHTDTEVSWKVKEAYGVEVTRSAVGKIRDEIGIARPEKAKRADAGRARKSKLDPWADRMGHEKDEVIASEANVSKQAVAYYRKSRGIPAYWQEAPGGNNHEVLSVEPVGEHEVWDIEVDHEDHNFALASGVFVHNSQYMAKVETVHKLICKTEVPAKDKATGKKLDDGTTDLPYALMALSKVRNMRDNWLKGAPEFERGWEKEISTFKQLGFLVEPVTGRRRDFLDSQGDKEAANEIVNFPIQSTAAGLMNLALIQLYELIPLHKWGPGTGIINQCHDSIVVECPADGCHEVEVTDPKTGAVTKKMYVRPGSIPEQVARMLEECMNQEHPSLPGVKFTASASIGLSWKDVG